MDNNLPIVSTSYVSPIGKLTYQELKVAFKNKLANRVKSAYLFGSIVSNTDKANDVDIVLIKDTKTNFIDRSKEFFDLYDFACPIDILVYTPEEFDLLKNSNSSFWRSFLNCSDLIL